MKAKRDVKPMLAKDTTVEREEGTVSILQPKLNGVRGIYCPDEGKLRSRNGLHLISCKHIEEEILALGLGNAWLDGEVYEKGTHFEDINGLARREIPSPSLSFWVFDIIAEGMTQDLRIKVLESLEFGEKVRRVPSVESDKIQSAYKQVLNHGYEGLILRTPKGFYEHKRSGNLRRIKPSFVLEATLLGFSAAVGERNKATFGSLRLVDSDGREFNCSGLSDLVRERLWKTQPLGAKVLVECGAFSKVGTPIFPRFKGLLEGGE